MCYNVTFQHIHSLHWSNYDNPHFSFFDFTLWLDPWRCFLLFPHKIHNRLFWTVPPSMISNMKNSLYQTNSSVVSSTILIAFPVRSSTILWYGWIQPYLSCPVSLLSMNPKIFVISCWNGLIGLFHMETLYFSKVFTSLYLA